MKSKPFVDTVVVNVSAGNGGNGCVSFRREKFVPRGGPDGGDGGRGGHIIFEFDSQQDSLAPLFFTPELRAEHGGHGSGGRRHGRNGHDLVVRVPPGTVVRDINADLLLGELVAVDERLLVARGGKGGRGNCHWATPSHQAPREHTDGVTGETRALRVELKTVAEAGLIGCPNAGKSSLLDALTRARSKVGAYPFTTLHPVIGVLEGPDHQRMRIADVPGLIREAHLGHGLGIAFLRHIERASSLVMVLDMGGTEGRDPVDDYEQVTEEIRHYNPEMPGRVVLIVANKMDVPGADKNLEAFKQRTGKEAVPVSTLSGDGIEDLKRLLVRMAPPPRN